MLAIRTKGDQWWLEEVGLFESFHFVKAKCSTKERNFYNEQGHRIQNKIGTDLYTIYSPVEEVLYHGRITNVKFAWELFYNLEII